MLKLMDDSHYDEWQAELCPICHVELEWVDCGWCGGDGYIDETDIDPDGDEMATCQDCMGDGGWLECPNLPHNEEATQWP